MWRGPEQPHTFTIPSCRGPPRPIPMAHFSEYPGFTMYRGHLHSQNKVLSCDLEGVKSTYCGCTHSRVKQSLSDPENNEGLEEHAQGACRQWHLARLERGLAFSRLPLPPPSITLPLPPSTMQPLYPLPKRAKITHSPAGHPTSFEDWAPDS